MTTASRDGSCPCGSGLPYAECCGARADRRRPAPISASVRESAIAKLLAFAFQPDFDSDHSIGEGLFWGDLLRGASAGELQWLMDSEDATIKYNSWFLFDWDVDGQGTAAELFLEEESTGLSALERQFLERLSRTYQGLYEVEEVRDGEGVGLLDLLSGQRVFVIERAATRHIVTWDLLGARIAPDGAGGLVFEGGLYLYPASVKPRVTAHFRRLYRRHLRRYPEDDVRAFFRRHGVVFNHLWLKLVAFPQTPRVTTDEGDPLVFCQAVFGTDRAEEVRALLARHADVTQLDEARFALLERTGDAPRAIGTWCLEPGRLVFETTSRSRAARGRAWIESIAGPRVRYRATALETLEQTLDDIRRAPATPLRTAAEPAETETVRAFYDRHYSTWLDRPLAVLGNRTPRAAVRTKLWRQRVIELLKHMENDRARSVLYGRVPYDFRWIWRELGIERPSGLPHRHSARRA